MEPVLRMPSMMRNSENLSPILQLDVDDVIRKPRDAYTANLGICDARYRRTDVGPRSDAVDHRVDRAKKVAAETGSAALIPARCLGHFGLRVRADSKATCQRVLRSRSSRLRTSGHELPGSLPDRARAARRSISSAHAASASSSAAASRLAISSDASSARSPRSSFRASASSFDAFFVTPRKLARGWPPNKPLERAGGGAVYSYRAVTSAGRSAPIRWAVWPPRT